MKSIRECLVKKLKMFITSECLEIFNKLTLLLSKGFAWDKYTMNNMFFMSTYIKESTLMYSLYLW